MSTIKATAEDLRHAYRLLPGREPDPEGLRTHRSLIRCTRALPVVEVALARFDAT